MNFCVEWKIQISGKFSTLLIVQLSLISILSGLISIARLIAYRRTVKDSQTGQNVVLSDKDVDFVKRLQSGKIPDANFETFEVLIATI